MPRVVSAIRNVLIQVVVALAASALTITTAASPEPAPDLSTALSILARSAELGAARMPAPLAPSTLAAPAKANSKPDSQATRDPRLAKYGEKYGELPLAFEVNEGQADPGIKYHARAAGYSLGITATEAWLLVRGEQSAPRRTAALEDSRTEALKAPSLALKYTWLEANTEAESHPESPLPGKVNYFRGSDPEKWRTGIATYGKVRYAEIYPGIDLVYYGNGRSLEYDLIVAPGTDPKIIRLAIEGASAAMTEQGDISLRLSDGRALTQQAPVIYQEREGTREPVTGHYVLAQKDNIAEVGFAVGDYNKQRPLVIDPLVYSTILGGSGSDGGLAIAINAANEAFVTGDTSADFPTTPGAIDTSHNSPGTADVFVTRLNAAGNGLIYSTVLGGSGTDVGYSIAINAANEAFVTGYTTADFPTTPGAFDTSHNSPGKPDVFVTRLNAAGNGLIYSTILGGSGTDIGHGVAINATNEAFVTGYTTYDFPTTPGAFDTSHNSPARPDVFVTRLNATGTALIYSTVLGSDGTDIGYAIAVNPFTNEAFVTGKASCDVFLDFPTTAGAYDSYCYGSISDAFVTRLNATGTALDYSTFLGGSGYDEGRAIAVNPFTNEAFVTGHTESVFPTTAGAFDTSHNSPGTADVFVTRLNAAGNDLIYSTVLGGNGTDEGLGIAVNFLTNEAFVTGVTNSGNFPVTLGAFDLLHNGGTDVFVTRLNAAGTALIYSTVLGGSDNDKGYGIAINTANEAFVTGYTTSANFPTTPGAFDKTHHSPGVGDAFVTRLPTNLPVAGLTFNGQTEGTISSPVTVTLNATGIQGLELFLIFLSPWGLWYYVDNTNTSILLPPDIATITPFIYPAPADGQHTLFSNLPLPPGVYVVYIGADYHVDGHLSLNEAAIIDGVATGYVVTVQ